MAHLCSRACKLYTNSMWLTGMRYLLWLVCQWHTPRYLDIECLDGRIYVCTLTPGILARQLYCSSQTAQSHRTATQVLLNRLWYFPLVWPKEHRPSWIASEEGQKRACNPFPTKIYDPCGLIREGVLKVDHNASLECRFLTVIPGIPLWLRVCSTFGVG